jgi:hypothetical protein
MNCKVRRAGAYHLAAVGRGVAESDDVFHDDNPDSKTLMKMTKRRLLFGYVFVGFQRDTRPRWIDVK